MLSIGAICIATCIVYAAQNFATNYLAKQETVQIIDHTKFPTGMNTKHIKRTISMQFLLGDNTPVYLWGTCKTDKQLSEIDFSHIKIEAHHALAAKYSDYTYDTFINTKNKDKVLFDLTEVERALSNELNSTITLTILSCSVGGY